MPNMEPGPVHRGPSAPPPGEALLAGAAAGALYAAFDGAATAWTGYAVPLPLLLAGISIDVAAGALVGLLALVSSAALRFLPAVRLRTPGSIWALCAVGLLGLLSVAADPFLRTSLLDRWAGLEGAARVVVLVAMLGLSGAAFRLALRFTPRAEELAAQGGPGPGRGAVPGPSRARSAAESLLPAGGAIAAFTVIYGTAAGRWLPPLSHPLNPAFAAGLALAAGLVAWRVDLWRSGRAMLRTGPALAGTLGVALGLTLAASLAAGVRDAGEGKASIAPRGAPPSPDTTAPDPATGSSQARKPDVFLIVLSSTRADHLSLYGYERPTSPHLEAFAREALVIERARASSPIALGAFASIFTGLLPLQHRADQARQGVATGQAHARNLATARALEPGFLTLAERLREAGYRTAGFSANSGFLDPAFGLHQGFEAWDAGARLELERPPAALPVLRHLAPAWTTWMLDPFRPAETLNAQGLAWLDAPDSRPAFLFLGYIEPHDPYIPRPPFDSRFGSMDHGWRDPWMAVINGRRALTEADRRQIVDRYDGEIAAVDAALGAFLDALRARGRFQDSLILVTADHGEDLGEQGLFHHGLGLLEPVLRVPFLVRYPGGRLAKRVVGPAHVVDVVPTVLEAVGLPIPAGLPGRSATETAGDAGSSERALLAVRSWSRLDVQNFGPRFDFERTCMATGPWKYCEDDRGGRALFHLDQDPRELDNRVEALPEQARAMAERLEAERTTLLASPLIPPGTGTAGTPSASDGGIEMREAAREP